ncbi:MAG: hypothetical protein J3Q66DRAFT_369863 [Benniella sp.]|nr:MAG: hypothetical protein J3Q66DRAFT_369863 [Benniella sp.]
MVSKIFALTLLAAVASNVNAYYWHAETVFQHLSQDIVKYVIHPVDIQVPGNDEAVVAVGGIILNEDTEGMTLLFKKHGYEDINMALDRANGELISLRAMDRQKEIAVFSCAKMDEIDEEGFYNHMVTRKVYSCGNSAYYGRKGIPVPTPTTLALVTPTTVAVATTTPPAVVTTMTTNVVTTTNLPTTIVTSVATEPIITTTTLAPQPTPTCLAGYRGKRNGKGPNGACCSHSDDCKDTCVKGVCGVSP